MAKIIKFDKDKDAKKNEEKDVKANGFFDLLDFDSFLNLLNDEDKKLLQQLGIDSMEKMKQTLLSSGINLEDLAKGHLGGFEDSDEDDDYDEDDEFDENVNEEDEDYIGPGAWMPVPKGLFIKTEEPVREFHVRIKLNNSPINIWRELKVPSNISLELLAQFFIVAMGWENEHLHQFYKKDTYYLNTYDLKQENDSFGGFWGTGGTFSQNADETALSEVLLAKGERMKFEYDFGDSWTHDVWVKGIREYEADEKPIVTLVKGKGACPPEDCGGVWGYEELLEIRTKKRKSADDKERLDWYGMSGRSFDPEFFDDELAEGDVEFYWKKIAKEMIKREKEAKKD